MAKKVTTITAGDLMNIASTLIGTWDVQKDKIHIRGKALFAFIGLKKDLEKRLTTLQETIATIAQQHKGVFKQEIGGFEIPPEERESANKAIEEVMSEKIEIAHNPIVVAENDHLPAEVLDAIFEFVEMEE